MWSEDQGKGIDDYIQRNGIRKFQDILGQAQNIKEWEAQFKDEEKEKSKQPPSSILSVEIAEDYRGKFAFNNQTKKWMEYENKSPGVWEAKSEEYFESVVCQIVLGKGITYKSNSFITDIVKGLRHHLLVDQWIEPPANQLLPFKNGVLEIATNKMMAHSPHYRFTWTLPREHNPLETDWPIIKEFLNFAMGGNEKLVKLLCCFANAVLTGRNELQKALFLLGPGETGKSTYFQLLSDLIGQPNVLSTSLSILCSSQFELARACGKRLVMCSDDDKKVGNLGTFKSLTGGDLLRGEKKCKDAFEFNYTGLAILSANYPIFSGDNSSGLNRRIKTIPFTHAPPLSKKKDLRKEWQEELAAFTNYLLSLDPEEVKTIILDDEEIPELKLASWKARMPNDSIAAWLDELVIREADARIPVGGDNSDISKAYGSYYKWCDGHGFRPKSSKNFSPDLLELCNSILGWKEVEKSRTSSGYVFKGLRIRTEYDYDIPTYEFYLEEQQNSVGSEEECRVSVGSSVGPEPSHSKGSVGCVGSEQSAGHIEKKENKNIFSSSLSSKESIYPTHPTQTIQSKGFNPTSHPTSPYTNEEQQLREEYKDFPQMPGRSLNELKKCKTKAKEIREALLCCLYKEDVDKIESKYLYSQVFWVLERLSEEERTQFGNAKLRSSLIPGLYDP